MTEDKKQLQPQTPRPKTKKTNHSFGQGQEQNELRQEKPFANIKRPKQRKANKQVQKGNSSTSKTPYLERFTTNLTEKVRSKIDKFEAYGRDEEIDEIIVSLLRQNKNSPALVGEAGVGKTAIVEGFCARCIRGQVPKEFRNITVRSLELSAIKAVTLNEKGEKEDIIAKINKIVAELIKYKSEYILFIDEVHTIMGTGAGDGATLDVANALKQALARGEIFLISATTPKEFTFIEKDEAMERRLQPIRVEEPNRDEALYIMKKLKPRYENVHGVIITDEALAATVDLSIRYMADKQLPDKAIDLIDEATSRAYVSGDDTIGLVDIAKIVSRKKHIPLESIVRISEGDRKSIEDEIGKVVKGQPHAIHSICAVVYKGLVGMQNRNRPIGSGMLLGTTGVGKTELAKQLAIQLFGTADSMIRIDCTEYQNKESVYQLIGNPTTGEKGYLTEKVKLNPYSLLLFDEIEKAHPDVHNLLLQVLDDGHLTNVDGRTIDFSNTVVIATSNAGHKTIQNKYHISGDFSKLDQQSLKTFMANIERDLKTIFRPEFINRWGFLSVMNMLTENIIKEIIENKMESLEKRWEKELNLSVQYLDENGNDNRKVFYEYLKNIGTNEKNGARPLERAIDDNLTNVISRQMYFLPGTHTDHYTATVVLRGKPPLAHRNSNNEVTVVDRRYLDISVVKDTVNQHERA